MPLGLHKVKGQTHERQVGNWQATELKRKSKVARSVRESMFRFWLASLKTKRKTEAGSFPLLSQDTE